MSRQPLLWCRACGREGKLKKGLCLACYSKERRSHAYFGGMRWRVLARDRSACRVYGRPVAASASMCITAGRGLLKKDS